jgi:ankyrin repeat protein
MTTTLTQELWHAARNGDLNALNHALSQGVDVNTRGDYGDTALNLAAENGHVNIVERLLEAGADVENLGGADKTPLMNACFAGQMKIVQILLNKGARVSNDLLSSLQLKVNILEENAEDGMVLPEAAEAWRKFFEYMIGIWQQQNPQDAPGADEG